MDGTGPADIPGTPTRSSRATERPYGLRLYPRAIQTLAVGFAIGRPSFAITRKLNRIGPGEKSASPGVSAIVVFPPSARASSVPVETLR
jgi:hypothetical protein